MSENKKDNDKITEQTDQAGVSSKNTKNDNDKIDTIRDINVLLLIAYGVLLIVLLLIGFWLFKNDSSNFDIASFLGAIIGFCGIVITICFSNISLKKQLRAERKNNFDSAINVENYKYYVGLASYCQDAELKIQRILNRLNEFKKNNIYVNDLDYIQSCFQTDSDLFKKFIEKSSEFSAIQSYADIKNKTKISEFINDETFKATKIVEKLLNIRAQVEVSIMTGRKDKATDVYNENIDDIISTFENEQMFYGIVGSKVMETANNLIK